MQNTDQTVTQVYVLELRTISWGILRDVDLVFGVTARRVTDSQFPTGTTAGRV